MRSDSFPRPTKARKPLGTRELVKNRSLYLMFLPAMGLLFVFNYLPLAGLVLAFKDVSFADGIWKSPWTSPIYNNFIFLFSSDSALRAFRNTLLLNSVFIVSGVIVEVALAILLNEITRRHFRNLAQTLTLLPYFVSWIVVGVFSYNLFATRNGLINSLLASAAIKGVEWFSTPQVWPAILMLINLWKIAGYGAIIYLAALLGIDPAYYEAADIDGASKLKKITHITLPNLWPTIAVMTLLQVGKIMNADFGMFYAIVGSASQVYVTADVVDTFVFRGLRQTGDIGMASAAGFVQSIVSFGLVLAANWGAKRIDKETAIF